MLRKARETKLRLIQESNKRLLEQSWESKIKQGEHTLLHKALGLLTPDKLMEVLKGCKVPIQPKCKGKNITQDKDCLPLTTIMKYGKCLTKAVG